MTHVYTSICMQYMSSFDALVTLLHFTDEGSVWSFVKAKSLSLPGPVRASAEHSSATHPSSTAEHAFFKHSIYDSHGPHFPLNQKQR